ncbi:MAG: MFS transporter, partial [Deltaproteobacteria bacterium]|nr:MFS transporter [Deltaproteobacteria bacterium]
MSRLKLPEFIHAVIDDPPKRGILISGCLALFAVGLTPRLLSPGLPTVQAAIRVEPEVGTLYLLIALLSSAVIIIGGLVSDIFRRRSLFIGALAVMALGSLVSLLVSDGWIFYAANIAAISATGVALAYGIGAVALAYEGIARATALGFVYAAFGVGTAISPLVLTLFPSLRPSDDPTALSTVDFDTWLAYSLTAIASGIALWAALRWMPPIPGTLPAARWLIVGIAVWSMGILAIVTGVLSLGGPAGSPVPVAMIVGGALALGTMRWRFGRTKEQFGNLGLDRRAIGAALAVGVAVGFAQAVPLMLLPMVFEYPLGFGTFFAILAIVPFVIAMVVAGPISGILIRRFGPRGMMSSGTLAVGVANLALAAILVWIASVVRDGFAADPDRTDAGLGEWHYVLFILPLILVGAGFVLSTTVRTAIVFASTPRGLPSSAAAINEASVGLGSRIGIVAATTAMTLAALGSAREMLAGRPVEEAKALVDEFEVALLALGTPRHEEVFAASFENAEPIKRAAYSVAYIEGVVVALLIGGLVGIVGAVLAWFLT